VDLGIISTVLNWIFFFFVKIVIWSIIAFFMFFLMLFVGTSIREVMDSTGIEASPIAIGTFVCCGFPLIVYLTIFAIAWAITRKKSS
jgi:hypothetical protein